MERFQPILIKNLNIAVQGNLIQRIAMNRHMPKVDQIKDHDHSFDQWLLYLRGSGLQRIGKRAFPIRRGSLVFLPREQLHGFKKLNNQSPLCLAIDLELNTGAGEPSPTICEMNTESVSGIERGLLRLAKLKRRTSVFSIAAEVMMILQEFEQVSVAKPERGKTISEVRNWLNDKGFEEGNVMPADIAMGLGMSVDQLNRKIKYEGGATVGDLLSSMRFSKAEELLRRTELSIGEVAQQVGMLDQNYFTRWFRKQCGQTPSDWRRNQ